MSARPLRPRLTAFLTFLALAAVAIYAVACVRWHGILALSDDDYARIVIAESQARAARLDPSGTSWLPLPFWLYGACIRAGNAFDLAPLGAARLLPWLLSVAGVWLCYAAGRALSLSRTAACLGAAIGIGTVQAAQLASMTGPEYLTACLCCFALAARGASLHALTPANRRNALGWASGVAVHIAALSRYEAWPIAFVVAVLGLAPRPDTRLWRRCCEAAVALSAPLLWLALNAQNHGNTLDFLQRVAAYRDSLGAHFSTAHVLADYTRALVFASPGVSGALAWITLHSLYRPPQRRTFWLVASPLCGALLMLIFLAAGALAGGVPTHHPERALLTLWLVAGIAIASRPHLGWPLAVIQLLTLPISAAKTDGFSRQEHELLGANVRMRRSAAERVFVSTSDYGYFAVLAALGGDEHGSVDQPHDPRQRDPESQFRELKDVTRLRRRGVRYVVAPPPAGRPPYAVERGKALSLYDLTRVPTP